MLRNVELVISVPNFLPTKLILKELITKLLFLIIILDILEQDPVWIIVC